MRYFLLLFLVFGMGFNTACSKKSHTTTATAPTPDDDDNDNNDNNQYDIPNPVNDSYYTGYVSIQNRATYKNFLRSAFGYQAYGGSYYGNTYNYNYSYTCDLNIFRWIFDNNLLDCSSGQTQYNDYVNDLSYEPAMIELVFLDNNQVEGRWLVGAYTNFSGQVTYYEEVPFRGTLSKLSDGRYLIEAGPLALLTTTSGSTVNVTNFNVYMDEMYFGNVTIH